MYRPITTAIRFPELLAYHGPPPTQNEIRAHRNAGAALA
jgi:hypothetical protein